MHRRFTDPRIDVLTWRMYAMRLVFHCGSGSTAIFCSQRNRGRTAPTDKPLIRWASLAAPATPCTDSSHASLPHPLARHSVAQHAIHAQTIAFVAKLVAFASSPMLSVTLGPVSRKRSHHVSLAIPAPHQHALDPALHQLQHADVDLQSAGALQPDRRNRSLPRLQCDLV